MKVKTIVKTFAVSTILITGFSFVYRPDVPGQTEDTLKQGFLSPPNSAKPRTWWHWMNGNISKEGITADLEWMKRIGIGGFQNFDAGLEVPQIVDSRPVYMTPAWKDAFAHTVKLADELGLEMAVASSAGWSVTGGPWVRPNEAMKKYVWSEILIEGGKTFTGKLPKPYTVSGPFQNIMRPVRRNTPTPYWEHYADVAVIAYRLPESYQSLSGLNPVITSSGGKFNLAQLTDGDLEITSTLPFAVEVGQSAWIQYEFSSPVTMQALSIVGGTAQGMGASTTERFLEAGNDGITFYKVIDISTGGAPQKTLSFQPTTAKYFRFAWKRAPSTTPSSGQVAGGTSRITATGYNIAELVLHPNARVHRFEEKAAFAVATDLYDAFTPPTADVVNKSDVINITDKMNLDGTLNWTPPTGKWMILRLGYSLTGYTNSPASTEATGLEVDKLNAQHVTSYFTQFLDRFNDASQGLMGKRGLQYVLTDSYEAGYANWTDLMMVAFEKNRGYSMIPWLPVLSGQIIESAEASDKFLWDFRKTLADLVVENHYVQLSTLLKERGMGLYSESHAQNRAFIADGMQVVGNADVPMGEFWTPPQYPKRI